jgi:hypothetical protein
LDLFPIAQELLNLKALGARERRLTNPDVQAAVMAGQRVHLERADLKKERVLEEYRRIAFLDPRGFWERVEERRVTGPVTVVRLKPSPNSTRSTRRASPASRPSSRTWSPATGRPTWCTR